MRSLPFLALASLLAASPALAAAEPARGSDAEVMREAEETLRDEGYLARADGVFDEETRRALRRFQEQRALQVTGELDELTMLSLGIGPDQGQAATVESERQEQVGQPPHDPQVGTVPNQ